MGEEEKEEEKWDRDEKFLPALDLSSVAYSVPH
jgi:hypothetical protein